MRRWVFADVADGPSRLNALKSSPNRSSWLNIIRLPDTLNCSKRSSNAEDELSACATATFRMLRRELAPASSSEEIGSRSVMLESGRVKRVWVSGLFDGTRLRGGTTS